jgi:hypothetical protein
MDGQFDGERQSRLRLRTPKSAPELDSAGDRAHELRELKHWYPHEDVEQGMWLPRSAEPLSDRTLPEDLAGLFAHLKRRVLRMLQGQPPADG